MKLIIEDLKDTAKDYFGTTLNWKQAFYINTDGTLLDGSGRKFGSNSNVRSIDHREIYDIQDLSNLSDSYEAMLSYLKNGNIRLSPEYPGIQLIKEPTSAQYNTILKILRDVDNFVIDFNNNRGEALDTLEYDFVQPSKVLRDLHNYFQKDN